MKRFSSFLAEKQFTNEIGNKISITVTNKKISGVNGKLLKIVGPNSQTDDTITDKEAEILAKELNKALENTND